MQPLNLLHLIDYMPLEECAFAVYAPAQAHKGDVVNAGAELNRMASFSNNYLTLAGLSPSDETSHIIRIVVLGAAFVATLLLANLIKSLGRFIRNASILQSIPAAPGSNVLLGHVFPLLKAPKEGRGAWDVMEEWSKSAKRGLVRFRVLGTNGVIVNDPLLLKRIFQTRFKIYGKDLTLSYHPFMPILGTGLVTADGDLWQKQRLLMGPALRVEILDDIVDIAQRGATRLADKLEQYRGTGQIVHLEEEFRLMTLQIIGEAILSLPPEECDRVSVDGLVTAVDSC